jgi:hypothetical protein
MFGFFDHTGLTRGMATIHRKLGHFVIRSKDFNYLGM